MKKFTLITIFILCLAVELHAQKKPEIDRSQFKISAEKVEFSENGGKKTLTVISDNEWSIKSKPESWVSVAKNGNTLQLSVGKNNSTTRLATDFTITSMNKNIRIKITQSGASILEVTPTSVYFQSGGGTKSFTVNSTKAWNIGTSTASWGHLDKSGNSIILKVDANRQTSPRTDYFIITSGDKRVKVDISQSATNNKSKANANFSISSSSANFGPNGGSKTFTITSSNSWQIYTNTASWGHIYRSGNNITLTIDANNHANARSDYFTIRSGDKIIRVDISQSGISPKSEISEASANFSAAGGTKTFSVTSTYSWQIGAKTISWGHLTKDGNNLVLKIDANTRTSPRTDYFTIKSGNKSIRVDISQSAAMPYLSVNGSEDVVKLDYSSYGSRIYIPVNTNIGDYEIWGRPVWCHISDRTSNGFYLSCNRNNSSYSRSDYMEIRANGKKVRIEITQSFDIDKYFRRIDGGWINMALGFEGGYGIKHGTWYSNAIIGMRIGNYRDLFQFEIGVAPGLTTYHYDDSSYDSSSVNFHLPVYASLKLSIRSGGFYFKIGGAYNIIRDKDYEGAYSLRAGFGSAWKHFEWDWAFIQFNAAGNYCDSDMMIGMRMAWYITR